MSLKEKNELHEIKTGARDPQSFVLLIVQGVQVRKGQAKAGNEGHQQGDSPYTLVVVQQ